MKKRRRPNTFKLISQIVPTNALLLICHILSHIFFTLSQTHFSKSIFKSAAHITLFYGAEGVDNICTLTLFLACPNWQQRVHDVFFTRTIKSLTSFHKQICYKKPFTNSQVFFFRMVKVPWIDKISNEDIIKQVNKKRKIL
jgi:hypothetical protein